MTPGWGGVAPLEDAAPLEAPEEVPPEDPIPLLEEVVLPPEPLDPLVEDEAVDEPDADPVDPVVPPLEVLPAVDPLTPSGSLPLLHADATVKTHTVEKSRRCIGPQTRLSAPGRLGTAQDSNGHASTDEVELPSWPPFSSSTPTTSPSSR
jgi:hypothetical protein